MTLLVAWIGVDDHGVTSAYIAADSRISWGTNTHFDYGRKVFGLDHSPDLFGYCGDVLFPSLVLGQITEMADAGLLFARDANPDVKSQAVRAKIIDQFGKYPAAIGATVSAIQILHVSKDLDKPPKFNAFLFEWQQPSGWSFRPLPLPTQSGILVALGSGSTEFNNRLSSYDAGPTKGTSRAVFHCFCSTVMSGVDPCVGGAPQLVGLYRGLEQRAYKYGIIVNGQRYIFGASINDAIEPCGIQWRNDLFEVCDGRTMRRQEGAQPQPDPLREQ